MTVLTSVLAMLWARAAGVRRDEGQTMAEYGLILAGIALAVMAAVVLLGGAINTTFTNIIAQF